MSDPRVIISVVGSTNHHQIIWPEGWPLPRLDDVVGSPELGELYVRTIVWYPKGDEDGGSPEPFVYVVVGPRR